jgi:hypothetical protein
MHVEIFQNMNDIDYLQFTDSKILLLGVVVVVVVVVVNMNLQQ